MRIYESLDWGYFDKFNGVIDKYMPRNGEGDNKASQLVTAINKLVYKWYNDGDVYDNTYALDGRANDLSSYANWIYKYYKLSRVILENIYDISSEGEYENILKRLCDEFLKDDFLSDESKKPKVGSIYKCDGPFKYEEDSYEDDDQYYDDYED